MIRTTEQADDDLIIKNYLNEVKKPLKREKLESNEGLFSFFLFIENCGGLQCHKYNFIEHAGLAATVDAICSGHQIKIH